MRKIKFILNWITILWSIKPTKEGLIKIISNFELYMVTNKDYSEANRELLWYNIKTWDDIAENIQDEKLARSFLNKATETIRKNLLNW